jgi:ribose transport system ATP-binding protein
MTVTTETRQAVLGLSGIVKTFPGVKALKDVSFDVLPGEVHALLGENGAGKSTLMGVAAGSIVPDEGTITIGGRPVQHWSPVTARAEGVAIVYQHPALLPDLTVRENLAIALSSKLGEIDGDPDAWMRGQLERVGCSARLKARVSELTVAQRQLLELAKALALEPKVLILDEPTAPLGADMVERVFAEVREAAGRGVAVVYISHRLPEVRQIAHRVSVMRDGELRSTAPIDAISDEEILQLIVGRTVETAFPPKATPDMLGEPERGLRVEGLNSEGFHDVSLTVRPGEIVGLAGIAGNGQSEFLRALAGLEPASGEARLAGEPLPLGRPHSSHRAGVAFLPADRHEEGLEMGLSVRENAALGALSRFSSYGVVRAEREREAVEQLREELKIRTASLETPVSSLSGGNQQKIVLARALLEEPKLLLADEPTQGVDAGARVEMYRNLRDIASSGIPVLVTSSDSLELEGLCDRVLVFSRGHVVAELVGDDVTEEQLAKAIVTATTHRKQESAPQESALSGRLKQLRRSAGGDYTPAAILLAVVLVFGLYSWSVNELVLSSFNITSALTLLAALAFISLGQLCVVMTGGIDISVGPLAGLNVVIASFFVVDGKPGLVIVAGFASCSPRRCSSAC